ncbi:unnamed protein product [Bursaphelenchus xylophilus]|uniref:(pine wood nematode) hypothetical protein n=1 Tax=Bursaphelenchus xylophilus TaxID=6326 RepID=A0A7I8WZF9_BURXY|nr:unnamed protein product [Bursaphelenchus xylophilus]CAG9129367.1 unnamed protein product [Bursaphelenchus xylophilus]
MGDRKRLIIHDVITWKGTPRVQRLAHQRNPNEFPLEPRCQRADFISTNRFQLLVINKRFPATQIKEEFPARNTFHNWRAHALRMQEKKGSVRGYRLNHIDRRF